MKQLTLAAAVSVIAMGVTALVASPIEARPDAGGPAVVTRAEARAAAAALWSRLDVNHDGVLNRADRAATLAQRFAAVDADGNGQISRDEFAAAHGQRGDRAARRGGETAEHSERGAGSLMGRHPGGRGGMAGTRLGKAADTNADGAITRDEFNAAAELRFATADADHDGAITPAERQAAGQKMRAQRRATRPAAAN